MERLILARHGESEASARGLVNGEPAAGIGLTRRGEEQACALGDALAQEAIDLCVVTPLGRTRATAELALAGRTVPLEEMPGLADPRAGRFEGGQLEGYRVWASAAGSGEEAPGGGESRLAIVDRYAACYRALLSRPERTILAVIHALPIAYLLLAREGTAPRPTVDRVVRHAHAYRFTAPQLERALAVLDGWLGAPTW
jgi:broad specificity phosphatase PhoE